MPFECDSNRADAAAVPNDELVEDRADTPLFMFFWLLLVMIDYVTIFVLFRVYVCVGGCKHVIVCVCGNVCVCVFGYWIVHVHIRKLLDGLFLWFIVFSCFVFFSFFVDFMDFNFFFFFKTNHKF